MITFRIPEMTCGHCASTIARAVASIDKNARVEVSIPEKLLSVHGTAAENELAEAIQEAGYTTEKVNVPAALPAPASGGCCCGTRRPASSNGSGQPARRSSCGG